MSLTTVILPWPPGVNNLFKNAGKRRVKTDRYNSWLAEAALAVSEQRPAAVRGSFRAVILFDAPDRRIRDLDGLVKAPLDLLVKQGVIDDDHLAKRIVLEWSDRAPGKPGRAVITLEAA